MTAERQVRARKLPLTVFRLSQTEIDAGNAVAARLRITRNELARRAFLATVGLGCPPGGESGLTPRDIEVHYDE